MSRNNVYGETTCLGEDVPPCIKECAQCRGDKSTLLKMFLMVIGIFLLITVITSCVFYLTYSEVTVTCYGGGTTKSLVKHSDTLSKMKKKQQQNVLPNEERNISVPQPFQLNVLLEGKENIENSTNTTESTPSFNRGRGEHPNEQ